MDWKKLNPIAFIKGLSDSQKKNILTGIAMGSIPVTAVLSGVAGVKVNEKLEEYKTRERAGEDIPLKTKVLELGAIVSWPVITMTIGEIAIHGINAFNAAEVAALAAVVANQNRKSDLKDEKIKQEFGEEKAKEVDEYVDKKMKGYDPFEDPMQLILDEAVGREFHASIGTVKLGVQKAVNDKLKELSSPYGNENDEKIQLTVRELYEWISDEDVHISQPPAKKYMNIGWEGRDAIMNLSVDFEAGCTADGKRTCWIMSYSTLPTELKVYV